MGRKQDARAWRVACVDVGAPGSRALAWPLGVAQTGAMLHRPRVGAWDGERTAVGKERAVVADDIVARNLFRHDDDPRQELAKAGAPFKPFQLALVRTEILPRVLLLRAQRREGGRRHSTTGVGPSACLRHDAGRART